MLSSTKVKYFIDYQNQSRRGEEDCYHGVDDKDFCSWGSEFLSGCFLPSQAIFLTSLHSCDCFFFCLHHFLYITISPTLSRSEHRPLLFSLFNCYFPNGIWNTPGHTVIQPTTCHGFAQNCCFANN